MVKEAAALPGGHIDERLTELERTIDVLRTESEVAHALLGLSAAFAEVRSPEETLFAVVEKARELFGADRAFTLKLERACGRFQVLATSGIDEGEREILDQIAARTDGFPITRAALRERTPVFVSDAAEEPRYTPEERRLRRLGAFIAIPLIRSGREFGGLGLEFDVPRTFGAKETALARGFVQSVGVALANARRFRLLEKLRVFGLEVGSMLRLSGVVDRVARGAADLLSGDSAALYFYDGTKDELAIASAYGFAGALPERLTRLSLGGDEFAPLLRDRPVLVPDLGDGPGVDDRSSVLIAPVPGGEGMIGAIAVFFPKDYTIGPDEIEALSVLAAQSSVAVSNAQRFERQRIVARSLQEGLLSADMPPMDECDIGAVYEAASGETDVGGDFYDVFELTKDRFALVVGDVSGKGAEAAAQTAIAKYMLRAFAMRDPSPSSVLFHLNNALVRGYGEDRFATAVYGLFDAKAHSATIAVAGHPSPLIYRADGEEIEAIEAEGSLLGVFEDQQYQSKTFDMYPGDVFLAYTDGLTEARSEEDSKELYGRSRVEDSLARHCSKGSAAEIARRVFEDATAFGSINDDTVVLALACSKESP